MCLALGEPVSSSVGGDQRLDQLRDVLVLFGDLLEIDHAHGCSGGRSFWSSSRT